MLVLSCIQASGTSSVLNSEVVLNVWKNALAFLSQDHSYEQGLYPWVSKRGWSGTGLLASSRGLLPGSVRSSGSVFDKSLAEDVGL